MNEWGGRWILLSGWVCALYRKHPELLFVFNKHIVFTHLCMDKQPPLKYTGLRKYEFRIPHAQHIVRKPIACQSASVGIPSRCPDGGTSSWTAS